MNILSLLKLLGTAALLFGGTEPILAATVAQGLVVSLEHYDGHHGVLVALDKQMIDPDSCGRSDLYIIPDTNPHAQFVQAMLLTAQSSRRPITIILNGCLDGLPSVMAVQN